MHYGTQLKISTKSHHPLNKSNVARMKYLLRIFFPLKFIQPNIVQKKMLYIKSWIKFSSVPWLVTLCLPLLLKLVTISLLPPLIQPWFLITLPFLLLQDYQNLNSFSGLQKSKIALSNVTGTSLKQHGMSPGVYLRKNPPTLSSDLRLIPSISTLSSQELPIHLGE